MSRYTSDLFFACWGMWTGLDGVSNHQTKSVEPSLLSSIFVIPQNIEKMWENTRDNLKLPPRKQGKLLARIYTFRRVPKTIPQPWSTFYTSLVGTHLLIMWLDSERLYLLNFPRALGGGFFRRDLIIDCSRALRQMTQNPWK